MIVNQWQNIEDISCPQQSNQTNGDSICLSTGLDVIHYYAFNENNFNFDLILLIVTTIVFYILAYIGFIIKIARS